MGIEIVKAAVVHGRDLSGNAYKTLIAMALQALDKPKEGRPASLYFGGWGPLVMACGYEEGDPNSAGHTAVKRAIKELREGKHVTPMTTAARGTRQSYLVHPGGIGMGVTTDPQSTEERGSPVTLKGGHHRPQKGVKSDPERGSQVSLLGRSEEERGLTQDISLTQQPEPQEAPRQADSAHSFRGSPGSDCEECGRGYQNRAYHPLYLIGRA